MDTGLHSSSSSAWLAYFQANANRLSSLPWETGAELSGAERLVIADSICIFQRGEEGSGRTIGRFARRYAERTGDHDYPAALEAHFAEEARHARDLGRFIDLAGIPRVKREWSHSAFRNLRHNIGLDGALCVLITAELVAKVYYRALRASTSCALLQALCAQLLRDETQHARFQCQRLAILRASEPSCVKTFRHVLHGMLFVCAALVVARRHRAVLAAANVDRPTFTGMCKREWRAACRLINGSDRGMPAGASRTSELEPASA
jgi:hypothetical protein